MTTTAATVVALKHRQVTNRFRDATAFSPSSAIPFTPNGHIQRRWLERLQQQEVIRSASPGLYYLDQEAFAQMNARNRRTALLLLGALAVVLGVCVAFGLLRR